MNLETRFQSGPAFICRRKLPDGLNAWFGESRAAVVQRKESFAMDNCPA